jgi:hypothetical protein
MDSDEEIELSLEQILDMVCKYNDKDNIKQILESC